MWSRFWTKAFWTGMFWPPSDTTTPPVVDIIGDHLVTIAQRKHSVTSGARHSVTVARRQHFVTVPDEE